jgi:hypothetical protein
VCNFVLNNPSSEPCRIANISLFLHDFTWIGYDYGVNEPVGILEHLSPNSTLAANSNQTVRIPLPTTLRSGSVVYYRFDFSDGQSAQGELTVQ